MSKSVTRLFTQFLPEHYDLTIDLDEAAMRFSGHVVVSGRKVGRPSKRLTFHANGLKVTSGKITFRDKKESREITLKRINLQKSMHEVRLHTDSLLYPGAYTVEMDFEAPITRGMTGIYPCFYKRQETRDKRQDMRAAASASDQASGGVQTNIAHTESTLFATQFESHHAREAFPCIDEPEAKATFSLTLITEQGVEVLSNTPIERQESRDKSQETRDKRQDMQAIASASDQASGAVRAETSARARSASGEQSEPGEERADSERSDADTRGRGEDSQWLSARQSAGQAVPETVQLRGHETGQTPPQLMGKKRMLTQFQTTPRMSTYLLAFVAGDMINKTARTKSGVEVSTWATVAQPVESLDFALDVAVKSIEYFEDYFGVPYPLAKADHVALPDFSSGAMENWGLITYRERVMLAYPGDSGQSTLEQIALVIAHETSHQWFGNLVTMRWWDDLWLNESFANMMEYQCVDSFFPEWQVWNTFISSEGLSAFRRDAIAGVQAVRTDVHHPDEISSLFDPSIVYAKGGRLLYMLKNYVGDKAFRQGLSAYFKKHAFANTTGDDLWAALSEASGKDIGAFMTPWLTQSGFPMLIIEQIQETRDKRQDMRAIASASDTSPTSVQHLTSNVQLTQRHFQDDPIKADGRIWPVPLFAPEIESTDVMNTSQLNIAVTTNGPILLNQGSCGHYLVRYESEETKSYLRQQIAQKSLPEPDRLMALNAESMFAKAGYSDLGQVLTLLESYRNESSEPVWDMMALVIGEVRRFVDLDTSLEKPLKEFCLKLAKSEIARLGWEEKSGESSADQKLRGLVLGLGLYADDKKLTETALAKFAAAKDEKEKLPAELRSLIMVTPIKLGDRKAFDYLLDLHDSTTNSDLKNDAADALTGTRSPEWASELLARLKNAELVKPQDADRWLVYLLRNRYTRSVAWQWMIDNWGWLEKTYKHDKSYDYLPRYAASVVNTPEYATKFHELFDDKVDQPLLTRNIQLGSAEIATRLAWLDRDLKKVQHYFKSVR